MQVIPYLAFNGNCEEAFKFYEKSLGGKITGLFRHEGTPAASQVPKEWLQKIMHVRLEAHGAVLMGGDAPPNQYTKPQGFCVSIHVQDPAEAERVFKALSEGAKVQMPIQETFWALKFGMLVDRYGQPWMVNCEKAA